MIALLSLYLSIYGSAHLYFLIKARRAWYLHGTGYVLLSAALLFLLLAPIQAKVLEAQGNLWPALAIAWIGYLWMGFLFLFICCALPLDIYHIVLGAGQRLIGADWTGLMLSRRQNLGLAVAISCGLVVYGGYAAYKIEPRFITLRSAKLPPGIGRVRIAQISDLHLGLMTYPGRLTPVIEILKHAQPDLIVSTGDLIDGRMINEERAAASLREIHAPMGKYAVTGNHEFYGNVKRATAFTGKAGFTLLRGRTVVIDKFLSVTGVDDPAAGGNGEADGPSEADLLKIVPGSHFSLLLKHRPTIHAGSRGRFDLQLSGHTHRGQIFPFGMIVSLRYPVRHGRVSLPGGGHLYVSRGTGTWGPPVRLLAPAEVAIIDIVAAPPSKTQ
jgi:predicted MPP superfamily phosphohydrolase